MFQLVYSDMFQGSSIIITTTTIENSVDISKIYFFVGGGEGGGGGGGRVFLGNPVHSHHPRPWHHSMTTLSTALPRSPTSLETQFATPQTVSWTVTWCWQTIPPSRAFSNSVSIPRPVAWTTMLSLMRSIVR